MALNCEHSANYATNFRRALDLYVGNGRPYGVDAVAEVTGISTSTLYAYKRGEARPSFDGFMELVAALPAGFGNMVLSPTGLTGGAKPEDANINPNRLQTSICSMALALAEALEDDNRVDHIERATMEPIAHRLQKDLGVFLTGDVVSIKEVAE